MSVLTHDPADLAMPLRGGRIVAYPTEAVFGLGCDPHSERAVADLAALKQRSPEQGFLLIGSDFAQIAPYIDMGKTPADALDRAMATWPGPYTWIFPASPHVPSWLRGTRAGVALRVTGHAWAARVCEAFGAAIVSTSANPHGLPPARTAREAQAYFPTGLGAILDAPVGAQGRPSTIRDALTGAIARA
ncbi:L-threonylcarbamoyladenylate synthase [Achromobacter aloeverae]